MGAAQVTKGLMKVLPLFAMAAALCPTAGQAASRRSTPVAPVAVVPVERVLNEIKCDYLDFAYSDYARAARLGVGRLTGTVTLSLTRAGTGGEQIGVPISAGAIRLDAPVTARGGQVPVDNALTVPFAFDPQLALNPAAAGLDCSPGNRLAHPILSVTALAASLSRAGPGGGHAAIGSPLRYQGQFYLVLGDDAVDVVPVRIDPARVGADAILLQSFDARVETGTTSWFADVGPGTTEPRTPANALAAQAPLPGEAPPPPSGRVRQVPRSPLSRQAPAHRCVPDASGELLCY